MSKSTLDTIREACLWAKANGHELLRGGAWFDFTTTPWGCDSLGAVLLQRGLVQVIPDDLARPGFSELAKEALGEDDFWLRRWWMGWDRGNQITITIKVKDAEKETKDEVSASAVALWKELK